MMTSAVKTFGGEKHWDNFPKAKIGRPEQIASIVASLCSNDFSFMNGEVIDANGGFAKL